MTDPGNYRPIAVLSPFTKILERLIYNQLNHFLEKQNILFKHQFGFRKNYSTEQAILELTDNLKMKIDSSETICSIFLDLSKAFDTVNHQILLQKLYRYGIRGVPLLWFKSYLENRSQYVEVENVKSNPLTIQCGVPQGSTLGPLLFLIYVNDIPNCLEKPNIRTFADDITLFYSSNSLQDLEKTINEEFKHLLNYCSANKLSANFKKTHYMTISSPQKANKLKLNIHNIEEKNYIKYLGIYIDKNLNWAPHIQHINNKLSKNVGILFKLRDFLPINTLKQIYYSLIYPYLHYGIMSWGNTYPSRLTKIQTKQNKRIRCIFFSHNRESSAPYFKLLDILNIDNIFRLKISLLAHKISHNEANIPEVFQKYLIKVSDIHSHNTRYASNLNFHEPRVRSNYGKHTFKFAVTKIWEETPTNIKTLSYFQFKKKFKRILLNSQG